MPDDLRAAFQAAGEEYARRLDEKHALERAAAHALEARRASTANAGADALESLFAELDEQMDSADE